MKAFNQVKKVLASLVPVIMASASLALVGCDGRTTKPLCSEQSGPIEGITGVYNMNFRDNETFGVTTWKLKIMPEGKGSVRVQSLNSKEEIKINVCNVNGTYLLETEDKETSTYAQARLFVSQVGLQIAPILFDKTALDGAGIPNKLVVVPEKLKEFLGRTVSKKLEDFAQRFASKEDQQVLYIDNSEISAAKLLHFAKPELVNFTFYRE